VVAAWRALPAEYRTTLSRELAISGVPGQRYRASPMPFDAPAFLAVYAPQLVTHFHTTDPIAVLSFLAMIYEQARDIWPPSANGACVTLRLDQLRDLTVKQICDVYKAGDAWFLTKLAGGSEAAVERLPIFSRASVVRDCRMLAFWRVRADVDIPPESAQAFQDRRAPQPLLAF